MCMSIKLLTTKSNTYLRGRKYTLGYEELANPRFVDNVDTLAFEIC